MKAPTASAIEALARALYEDCGLAAYSRVPWASKVERRDLWLTWAAEHLEAGTVPEYVRPLQFDLPGVAS